MSRQLEKDAVHRYLASKGEAGASAADIAAEFFKAAGPAAPAWASVVSGLLQQNPCFAQRKDGNWIAVEPDRSQPAPLGATLFTVVEVVTGETQNVADCVLEFACAGVAGGQGDEPEVIPVNPNTMPSEEDLQTLNISAEDLKKAHRLPAAARRVLKSVGDSILVSIHSDAVMKLLGRAEGEEEGAEEVRDLSLLRVARRLEPGRRFKSRADFADAFGLEISEHSRASERAAMTADLLRIVLDRVAKMGIKTDQELLDFQFQESEDIDFSRYAFDRSFLSLLPRAPGVYVMKDPAGAVIYVGKAKDLRTRVCSYFKPARKRDEKNEEILRRVRSIEVEEKGSELEALLCEEKLIRQFSPPINTQMEVHERPATYGNRARLVLIVPSTEAGAAELFLAAPSGPVRQLRVKGNDLLEASAAIRSTFFPDQADKPGAATAPAPGSLFHSEIFWSWFFVNRDRVNYVEIELAASLTDAIRVLSNHLGERRPFETKVFHR